METETLPDPADASGRAVGSDLVSDKDSGMNLNQGTNCPRFPPCGASRERSESAAGEGIQTSEDLGRNGTILSNFSSFICFKKKNASMDSY